MEEYTPKTDEELKELALGLDHGRYFSSAHCHHPDDVGMVFLPLALSGKESLDFLQEQEITFVYEDVSKALPRCINGMPMFMSCHMLNKTDHHRLIEIAKKIKAALETI